MSRGSWVPPKFRQERADGDGISIDRRREDAHRSAPPRAGGRAPGPRRRDQPAQRRSLARPAPAAAPEEAQARPQGPDPEAARAADPRHHRLIALIQRVAHGAVRVDQEEIASIGKGLLALVAVERGDTDDAARRLAERVLAYRVFSDAAGKMNLSLKDVNGELLAVSQFTLAADTASGLRPSFSSAAAPDEGRRLFDLFVATAAQASAVKTGRFGADMKVSLVNDGPVTFWLQVK